MATVKKPIITAQPASLTGSVKRTTFAIRTAKKPLKPDTVVEKTPTAAPKITCLLNKTPSKQVVSKMASTKVSAVTIDKSASSLKLSPIKSSVTSPSKPVIAKTSVKRAVADSTHSDKEPVVKPVQKLSILTGLTKSTKVVTKPAAIGSLTTRAKVGTTKTKSSLADKLSAKPMAEKLSAKAELTSSTLRSKTSSVLIKPVTVSTLVKRPLTPKMVDIKKPVVSRAVLAKSVSKTATLVAKPPSIRTSTVDRKVMKKCTEVQICDADSTSLTINDQLEMELGLKFDTVESGETSVEFNEIQAYKVAEQMMEALGTAVMTNETVHQESLLKDLVVIDTSALEVASQTLSTEDETKVLEQTTDSESATVYNDSPKETEVEASILDLISFIEVVQEKELVNSELTVENTSEGVPEDTTVKGDFHDVTAESAHDRDEDMELSVKNQVGESAEVLSVEGTVSGEESQRMEKMASDEQIFERCAEDETRENKNCKEFFDAFEMSNNQCDFTRETEVEDENVYDYESCSVKIQVNDEDTETEERGEVIDERLSTVDLEITYKNEEDAVSSAEESQLEQPEEMSEEVVDPAISIDIQENHFCADSDPASLNVNSECNGDDFVVVEMGEEDGDENPEQVSLFADDCSVTDAEKSADTESVGSADSAVSYADVVKQSAVESASDFESIENVEALVDSKVDPNKNSSRQMVLDTDHLSTETAINEEDVAVSEAEANAEAIEAAEDTEASKAAGDVEATEAPEDGKAFDAAGEVKKNPVEEPTAKVEPLLGLMTDEVQQELDAGMEHSHIVDEEGYSKVQKKRNKKHNKRNRKSLRALQKENADFEPVIEVQESQDDLQVLQKRRNLRRTKNSTKKQYRRYSEPYSNSHCYSIPVWKSYYVEH